MKTNKKLILLASFSIITAHFSLNANLLRAGAGPAISRIAPSSTGGRGFLSRPSDWWTNFKNTLPQVEFVNPFKSTRGKLKISSPISGRDQRGAGSFDGEINEAFDSISTVDSGSISIHLPSISSDSYSSEGFDSRYGESGSISSRSIPALGDVFNPYDSPTANHRHRMLFTLIQDDEHMNGELGTTITNHGYLNQ